MLIELWSDLRYRMRALLRPRAMDRELDAEIRFHLEHEAEKYERLGLSHADAMREARIALGGVDRIKEESRDARGTRVIETTAQDFHHSLRSLRKTPGFTAVAVLTLALGIGACTVIFGAIDAVLLRSLPFPGLDRLMTVAASSERCPATACSNPSPGHYLVLRERTRAFTSLAGYASWSGTLGGREQAEHVNGVTVTPSFFSTLGVAPAIGRTFEADSASSSLGHEVILSDAFWRTRFGSDPHVVDSTITLSGEPYSVVGIMPPGVAFPTATDLWLPLSFPAAAANDLSGHWLRVIGRLAPGVAASGARSELEAISTVLATAHPDQAKGWRLVAQPLSESVLHQMREFFAPLMAAALCVLLIGCANVANLLLARASARQRDIAVRSALGASRSRLVRQLMTESVALALAGATLGAMFAWWSVPLLRGAVPASVARFVPGWSTFAPDGRALAFAIALSLVSALLAGVLPAMRASRPDLTASLRDGGHGATSVRGGRMRRVLVAAELALALVLLVSAGLMVQSVRNLLETETGLRAEHALTLSLELPASRYADTPRIGEVYTRLQSVVGALPGVQTAAAVSTLPLSHDRNFTFFNVSGRPPVPTANAPSAVSLIVTPGYFAALGIPLLRGRDFTVHDDTAAAPVAIVSRTMAQRFWPNESPVGHGLELYGTHYRIIGVAADVRDQIEHAPASTIYQSEFQIGNRNLTLVVRAACRTEARACDPASLAPSIRRAIGSVDRDIAVANVRTMPHVVTEYLAPWRLFMGLIAIFAALALVIAAVGVYGVMTYAVRQRTHEIGIRVALGAGRLGVIRMIVGDAARLAAWGTGVGVLGALAVGRVLASLMLYGVRPTDPAILGGVAILLAMVALFASWLPARRASAVDPMIALRNE